MNARISLGTRLAVSFVLLSAVACRATIPTSPTTGHRPMRARVSADGGARPFKLDATAVILSQERAPGSGPPAFARSDFGGRCALPSDLLLRFSLKGQATYLGELTGTVEHCTRVDFQTGRIAIGDGIMSLEAANGDELRAVYGGGSTERGTEEHMVFSGGTGRFSSASGEAVGRPACDQASGTCVLALEGDIAFDASDARGE